MCSIMEVPVKQDQYLNLIKRQNWLELNSGLVLDLSVLLKMMEKNEKLENPWLFRIGISTAKSFTYRYVTSILEFWYLSKFINQQNKIKEEKINQDELSWTRLPILVSVKLFRHMNFKTRKVARLVCSDWKCVVDKMIGVSLSVDEYRDSTSFLEFFESTKLEKISIGNISLIMEHMDLKYPRGLRIVTCQGNIEKNWFCSKLLQQCTNLTKLILKGEFLAKMPVTSTPQNYKKIICPNLKTLEIISPRGTVFPRHFAMSNYLNVFQDPINNDNNLILISPRNTEDSIQQTMLMILSTITSPKLSLFHIFVYENFFINKFQIYWKSSPFEKFLQDHQATLQELYLPEFRGKRSLKESDATQEIPKNLSSLELCIHRYHHLGGLATEQNQDYYKNLIKSQLKLKDLMLECHKMRTHWIMDILQSVVDNTMRTLRVLKLQIVQADEDECTLNGHLLRDLTCLEELRLEGDALTTHVLTLSNFHWLPKNLKKILTMFMKIEQTDFSCINLFKQLKYIELNHIVLPNLNESKSFQYSLIFTKLLQQLLSHRQLDHLGLSLNKSIGSDENLRKLMETMATTPRVVKRSEYKPNYYGIVIAHQYEIDDKFDLYRPSNRENIFADDLMLYTRPKKETDKVSLVEVRVEVERREMSDFYDEEYDYDQDISQNHLSDFTNSSGIPSLHSIESLSDDHLDLERENSEDQNEHPLNLQDSS